MRYPYLSYTCSNTNHSLYPNKKMTKPIFAKQPVRWGIIGCGDVTEVKSGPAYQYTNDFILQAVMRRNRDKAEDYAKRHKVADVYDSAEALITADNIDAVYIATPPDSHQAYALQVAQAGKPCCIEKPMAPSYQACVTIQQAFEQRNLPLFVAYYRRTLPRFQQIHTWLTDNAIGSLRQVHWNLTKPPSLQDETAQPNWRTDAKVAPGGYFDDLASHGLDLLCYLLGDITQIFGLSANQQSLYSAKDAIVACWRHNNGVMGSGCWNFGCHDQQDHVTIEGSEGKIRFAVFDDTPVILENSEGRTESLIEHPHHVQLPHVQAMRDTLIEGAPHPASARSAVHTSWIMEQILHP